jgi:hypothetical protein
MKRHQGRFAVLVKRRKDRYLPLFGDATRERSSATRLNPCRATGPRWRKQRAERPSESHACLSLCWSAKKRDLRVQNRRRPGTAIRHERRAVATSVPALEALLGRARRPVGRRHGGGGLVKSSKAALDCMRAIRSVIRSRARFSASSTVTAWAGGLGRPSDAGTPWGKEDPPWAVSMKMRTSLAWLREALSGDHRA